MRVRSLICVLSLAGVSLFAGWWQAGFSVSQRSSDNDQWGEIAGVNMNAEDYAKLATMMRQSAMFPISRAEAKRLEELDADSEDNMIEGVPQFPDIIAASVLDGVPHIHLLLSDKTLVKAKSGDELESGWTLKSVDLRQVSAVYGDTEREFWVSNSDRDPVEK